MTTIETGAGGRQEGRKNFFEPPVQPVQNFGHGADGIAQIEDRGEFEAAVAAGEQTCGTLRIPARHNFHPVFVYDGLSVRSDYRLSRLACYLILVNVDRYNPAIIRAQLVLFGDY